MPINSKQSCLQRSLIGTSIFLSGNDHIKYDKVLIKIKNVKVYTPSRPKLYFNKLVLDYRKSINVQYCQ